jgi:hypothetical protein
MADREVRKFKIMNKHGGQNLGEMEIFKAINFVKEERRKDPSATLVEITKNQGGVTIDIPQD